MNFPSLPVLILSLVLAASTQATGLVSQEIMEPTTSADGKPLLACVEEVARSDRTSTVKVSVYSGTSVARAMVVVRRLWLIGETRGDEYFLDAQSKRFSGWDTNDCCWLRQRGR